MSQLGKSDNRGARHLAGENTEVTTLENGLRVASDPMEGVGSCCLGLWVGVGTRDEAPEVNGIAHLLEHMAFKGTARRSARDIAEEIEAVGGQMNAYTSRESTAYYARVLEEDLPLAVDLVSDILLNARYDQSELERERAVVLQEIGLAEDTPDDIVFDHFQATAYPDQPLGRPVLGEAGIVNAITREDLFGFVERHYRPEQMVLAASGAVDHAQLVEMAGEAFGGLKRSGESPQVAAAYTGGEFRQVKDLEQAHIVLGLGSVSLTDTEYYTAGVLSMVLGGGMSSRLFQEVREKRGLVYSVYSYGAHFMDHGMLTVYAGTGEAEAGETLAILADQLVQLQDGVNEEELARARAQARAGLVMSRESASARAEALANQLLTIGRPMPVRETLDSIEAVDSKAIAAMAKRMLKTPPTLAALGPVEGIESYERLSQRLG